MFNLYSIKVDTRLRRRTMIFNKRHCISLIFPQHIPETTIQNTPPLSATLLWASPESTASKVICEHSSAANVREETYFLMQFVAQNAGSASPRTYPQIAYSLGPTPANTTRLALIAARPKPKKKTKKTHYIPLRLLGLPSRTGSLSSRAARLPCQYRGFRNRPSVWSSPPSSPSRPRPRQLHTSSGPWR
jgi:hypothetical protein